MKVGLTIPTGREGIYVPVPFAGPEQLIELTKLAERLGFYSVWGNDHLNTPKSVRSRYQRPPNVYEVVVSLAYLACVTKRVKLGTAAMVLPLREPVLLAKQIATLDAFSGGRILLGVGVGISREEFEAVKPREIRSHRGAMFEELLEALQLLFTQEEASFNGKYYEFQGISLHPKPIQNPFPFYITGKPQETYMRVARWGMGYLMSRAEEKSVRERVQAVRALLEGEGRDVSEVDMATTRGISVAPTHEAAVRLFWSGWLGNANKGQSWERILAQNFVGTPSEIAEQFSQLKAEGITHCIIQEFATDTVEEMKEQVQMFAEEVLPLVGSIERP